MQLKTLSQLLLTLFTITTSPMLLHADDQGDQKEADAVSQDELVQEEQTEEDNEAMDEPPDEGEDL